jgi:hypothetical protein
MSAYPKVALLGATIERLDWMTGRCAGTEGETQIEEIWSPVDAGILMGSFRWLKGGAPHFYEFMLVKPGPKGLELHIKHFGPDLVGWEEKDVSTAFDLVPVAGREAVFHPGAGDRDGWSTGSRTTDGSNSNR